MKQETCNHQTPANHLISRASNGYDQAVARPSLEYHHAFDMCAVEFHRLGYSEAVIVASSAFYARELLKRMDSCRVTLVPTGAWRPNATGLENWLGPEVNYTNLQLSSRPNGSARLVIWAEPEKPDGLYLLRTIQQTLAPGGQLCILASGWLGRLLPEWRVAGSRPAHHPLGLPRMAAWLHQAGFDLKALYRLRSLSSFVLGVQAGRWNDLGRKDLADRDYYKIRETLVLPGPPTAWAHVSILFARKNVE